MDWSSILQGASQMLSNVGQIGTTAYNIWNSEQQKQREDNAVQRRAADLSAAGLSKTLAAGSAASASGGSSAIAAPSFKSSVYERTIAAQAMKKTDLEMKNLEANAANVAADTDLKNRQTQHYEIEEAFKTAQTALYNGQYRLLGIQEDQMRQSLQKGLHEIRALELKNQYTEKEIEYADRKLNAELQLTLSEVGLNVGNTDYYSSLSRMSDFSLKKAEELLATEKGMLENKLEGVILDNRMQMLHNRYFASTGQLAPTAGTWLFGGLDKITNGFAQSVSNGKQGYYWNPKVN